MSSLDNPNFAYITRLISGNSTDRHTVVIPKNFGTGGIIRIVYIDRNGNYSKSLIHVIPGNSFSLSGVDSYEAELSRINTEIQPELTGVLQKSLLVDQKVVEMVAKEVSDLAQTAAVAKAKADAEVAQTAAVAKAKADAEVNISAALTKARVEAEASIVAQNYLISQIQSEVESLKKLMSKKTTIVCIKGKLTRSVTGVVPECPVGYKSKK